MRKAKSARVRPLNLVLALVFTYASVMVVVQHVQIRDLTMQADRLNDDIAHLLQTKDELIQERDLLNTEAYIEKLAREQLGLVKPGEIPYTVTEDH